MGIGADDIQEKALTSIKDGEPKIPKAPGQPVEQLVDGVRNGLTGLREMFDITPGITQGDKVKLYRIIKEYNELIDVHLGAEPDSEIKEPQGLDMRPMEAGIAKVFQSL